MGSKHEQIGRTRENVDRGIRGKEKKKMPGCNTRLVLQNGDQSCHSLSGLKLHATDFGHVIRMQKAHHKPSHLITQNGSGQNQITDICMMEQKTALLKLQRITGQKISEANTIMRDGWLECSISGFLGDNSIVVVKSISSKISFNEAAEKDPNFCMRLLKGNRLSLSTEHDFWYEVQGCLQICDKEKCYFAVTNSQPQPPGHQEFCYQIVERDPSLWDNVLLPKLESYAK